MGRVHRRSQPQDRRHRHGRRLQPSRSRRQRVDQPGRDPGNKSTTTRTAMSTTSMATTSSTTTVTRSMTTATARIARAPSPASATTASASPRQLAGQDRGHQVPERGRLGSTDTRSGHPVRDRRRLPADQQLVGRGGFSQALLDAITAAGAANQLFVAAAGNARRTRTSRPRTRRPTTRPTSLRSPRPTITTTWRRSRTSARPRRPGGAGREHPVLPAGRRLPAPVRHLDGDAARRGVVGLAMGRFPSATNLFIKSLILSRVDVKPQLNGKVLSNGRLNALLAISDPDETPRARSRTWP